jgi:hypothetical protein
MSVVVGGAEGRATGRRREEAISHAEKEEREEEGWRVMVGGGSRRHRGRTIGNRGFAVSKKLGSQQKKLFANGHDEGSRQNSYFAVAILVLDGKILFAEKEFRQQTILPLVFFCRRRQNTFFPSQHEFIAK